jgi:hypothetical protein
MRFPASVALNWLRLPVQQDCRHARGNCASDPRSEDGILAHFDLLHEGEDARIAVHVRREAFICDVAVKHRPRRYVRQAVVCSLPSRPRQPI